MKSVIPRNCHQCGAEFNKEFLERQHRYYCSHTCWFDYLRARPKSSEQLFDKNGSVIKQEVYPMSFERVNPARARELIESEHPYTYLDVRSIPEFESGHPANALNVPLLHREQDQMVPNMHFLQVVELNFDHQAKLLIGCQSGARSLRAAEALVAAGFEQVVHVDGGFGGSRDEMGRTVEKGWIELGLPTEYGAADGQSYSSLGGKK